MSPLAGFTPYVIYRCLCVPFQMYGVVIPVRRCWRQPLLIIIYEYSWKFMSNKKNVNWFFFYMNFHELTMNSSPIKLGQNRPKQTFLHSEVGHGSPTSSLKPLVIMRYTNIRYSTLLNEAQYDYLSDEYYLFENTSVGISVVQFGLLCLGLETVAPSPCEG